MVGSLSADLNIRSPLNLKAVGKEEINWCCSSLSLPSLFCLDFSILRLVSTQFWSYGTNYEGQGEGKKVPAKLKWGKKEERWGSRRGHGNLQLVPTINIIFFFNKPCILGHSIF